MIEGIGSSRPSFIAFPYRLLMLLNHLGWTFKCSGCKKNIFLIGCVLDAYIRGFVYLLFALTSEYDMFSYIHQ